MLFGTFPSARNRSQSSFWMLSAMSLLRARVQHRTSIQSSAGENRPHPETRPSQTHTSVWPPIHGGVLVLDRPCRFGHFAANPNIEISNFKYGISMDPTERTLQVLEYIMAAGRGR